MINFSNTTIEEVVVHQVGNKIQEEPLIISARPLELKNEIVIQMLSKFLLSPFRDNKVFYHFTHNTDLNLNELYSYVSAFFAQQHDLYQTSVNISRHLYEQGQHPNIKGGELYVVFLKDCLVGDEIADAIGIFKSETKDTFLKVLHQQDAFNLSFEEGTNIKKLDKGCLIFNTEQHLGFRVCMVDNTNKSNEAVYWKESFLNLKPVQDTYFHTQNYLNLCKEFVHEVFNEEHHVAKPEQAAMLNKAIKYFAENEQFDKKDFEEKVMQEPEIIDAFEEYKEHFKEQKAVEIYDEFGISPQAVKSSKKFFKSVIKLDKNFHVYVHGTSENMTKGFDAERQMSYYQLFFKEEN